MGEWFDMFSRIKKNSPPPLHPTTATTTPKLHNLYIACPSRAHFLTDGFCGTPKNLEVSNAMRLIQYIEERNRLSFFWMKKSCTYSADHLFGITQDGILALVSSSMISCLCSNHYALLLFHLVFLSAKVKE